MFFSVLEMFPHDIIPFPFLIRSTHSVMILVTCLEHKYKVGYLVAAGGDKNLC
jgi:hypothetical protein